MTEGVLKMHGFCLLQPFKHQPKQFFGGWSRQVQIYGVEGLPLFSRLFAYRSPTYHLICFLILGNRRVSGTTVWVLAFSVTLHPVVCVSWATCCMEPSAKRPKGPSRGDSFAQVISELSQHLPVSFQNLGNRAWYAQNRGG